MRPSPLIKKMITGKAEIKVEDWKRGDKKLAVLWKSSLCLLKMAELEYCESRFREVPQVTVGRHL